MSPELQAIIDVVESWDVQRKLVKTFTLSDLNRFAETHNNITRQLIARFGRESVDFYSALAELSIHAQTLLTPSATFMVDGTNGKLR